MTKRRPTHDGKKFTAEVVTFYRYARDLHDNADTENWEEEGGRRREYLDATMQLNVLLDRREPWLPAILDTADVDVPPDWKPDQTMWAQGWRDAKAVLTALEQAAEAMQ